MHRVAAAHALVAVLAVLALAGPAFGSQLIDRDARNVHLAVNTKGEALLTYTARGGRQHVLAWGAVNARQPSTKTHQVRFGKDYSGGWGKYRKLYWRSFRNGCRPYEGPPLVFLVTACDAPDGSHWALQSWQTALPDLGMTPWLPNQRAWELHLSHWRGPIAQLEAHADWVGRARQHEVFGRLTYRSAPVYGFGTTHYGAPTDGYGRLVYLDTYNSRYGRGWRRENSFVSHNPTGAFCYTFYRFNPFTGGYTRPPGYSRGRRGPGNGSRYRLTVNGPGVTPDVAWVRRGLPRYDPRNPRLVAHEQAMNAVLDRLTAGDRLCGRH